MWTSSDVSFKRHKLTSPHRSWVTYERRYLVTLGLVLIVLTGFIWKKQGHNFAGWPAWSCLVFFCLPILGLVLVAVGLLAGRDRIEKWAGAVSRHEAGIIIMVVAFPVFLVMSLLERRER